MLSNFIGTYWLPLLLAMPFAYWLTTAVHELGHAVAAKLTGYQVAACGTGIGNVLCRVRVGETVYFIGLRQPTNGVTFTLYPRLITPRWLVAIHISGGIAANAALTAVALGVAGLLPYGAAWAVAWLVAAVNGFMAVTNLFPLKIAFGAHLVQSDGTQLIRILRGTTADRMLDVVNAERGLDGLFAELGQDRMRAKFRYHAARVWGTLGAVERAKEMLVAADELGPGPTDYERGMAEFCRAYVLDAEKDRAGATAAISRAQELFGAAGDPDAQWLCELIRIEILAEARDAAGVEAIIARWEQDPVPHPLKLAPVVTRVRLFARFLLGETAAAEELARALADEPDRAAVFPLLRQAGRVCRDRGDAVLTERMLRAACREVPAVTAGFGMAEDLATFSTVKQELVQEYRAAVASAGVEPDPDLPAWEADTAEPAKVAAEEVALRDRRKLWWGGTLVAAKFLLLAAIAWQLWLQLHRTSGYILGWDTYHFLLWYFCFGAANIVFTLLYLPIALLGRRLRPGAFPNVGRKTLGMALFAWLMSPVMSGAFACWDRADPRFEQRDRWFFDMNSSPDLWEFPEPDDEPDHEP